MYDKENNWTSKASFTEIYRCYAVKMYRMAYSYVHDEDAAREIVQHIFTVLWERRYQIEVQGSIEGYLIKATKYAVFRKLKNRVKGEVLTDVLPTDNSDGIDPAKQLIYKESVKQLDDLIEKLPEKRKSIFKLSRQDGLKNKEIAAALHISEKTVEYHIKHSLLYLKKKF